MIFEKIFRSKWHSTVPFRPTSPLSSRVQKEPLARLLMPKLKIASSVYELMQLSLGTLEPETGGLLLGNRETGYIDEFIFDEVASGQHAAVYFPDTKSLNAIAKSRDSKILGLAHSHPRSHQKQRLSGEYSATMGDLSQVANWFDAMPGLQWLYTPIWESSFDGGEATCVHYVNDRTRPLGKYYEAEIEIVPDGKKTIFTPPVVQSERQVQKDKLHGSVDMDFMATQKVLAVGCGGAASLYEGLIRLGLGSCTFFDFDTVDKSNLVTQGWDRGDLGVHKVDALKKRYESLVDWRTRSKQSYKFRRENILDIPEAELVELASQADLICCFTDDFKVNAMLNRLSLKTKTPAVFMLLHDRAESGEVFYQVPEKGWKQGCYRCAVSSRYEAYEKDSGQANASSNASNIFNAWNRNATAGEIVLAVLHRGHSNEWHYAGWLKDRANKNFIMMRYSPNFAQTQAFSKRLTHPDSVAQDSIWQTIEPEAPPKYAPCPDCGGHGDLSAVEINSIAYLPTQKNTGE